MTAACPTNPPDRKGKKITVVDVPKLIGIGYFNATSKGIATPPPNSATSTPRPTARPRPTSTSRSPSSTTTSPRGVDGILFAANDPVAIAPVLKKALAKGINVVGYDANSHARRPPVVRQPGRVQRHRQGAGRQHGRPRSARKARSPSSPRPSPRRTRRAGSPRWPPMPRSAIPKMKWLETVEAQEDNNLSFNQATTLINKYGDELKGIFGMTSVATPASAEAVTQARQVRQDRRRRPRHAERDEALCREGLREVGRAVEPGRPRLCRDAGAARRRRRHAAAGCHLGEGRQAGRPPGHQRLGDPARRALTSSTRTTSASSTSDPDRKPARWPSGRRATTSRKSEE